MVHHKTDTGAYVLKDKAGDIIRQSFPPSALKSVSEDPILQDDKHYVIDCIINHRGKPGEYKYKV